MLTKPWFLLVAFCLMSPFALSQSAQTQQRNRAVEGYSIRGKVVIPNAHDFDQRIEVRLEKVALQVIQTTFTDSVGNFDFRNVPSGSYTISLNVEGFEPVRQNVDVYGTFGNTMVTIVLNKPSFETRERAAGLDADDPDVVDISQMRDALPKKAVQDYEKAIDEKKKGKLESAVKLLQQAIQSAPNFFHAHNNLGIIYQALKRYPDAEKEYKRSHDLNAKADRPLVNLGSLYIEESSLQKPDEHASGELLDKALDALEEAVKLNPRSGVGFFLLGQANYKSDFLEEAEVAFKRAHDLDPRMTAARLMLANIYVKQQKWDDVIENLDAYLKENPKAADRASVEEMRAKIVKTAQAATTGEDRSPR
jgi:tetratricopeptide (TPR) repeat protein